jgi:hypothetical protein
MSEASNVPEVRFDLGDGLANRPAGIVHSAMKSPKLVGIEELHP